MYTRYLSSAIAVLAASQLAQAQTHTDCSPVKRDDCPDNPALGGTVEIDFTKGESKLFKSLSTPIIYSPTEGALFTIKTDQDSPTIEALKYIMFGRVDIKMQAAPGAGIVTSLVLESKDLDEIDLEWVGGNNGQVQSNYFSKGDTSTYDRGAVHAVSNPLGSSHVYSIDWTKDRIQWLIDGAVVRELTYAAAKGGSIYPQTPMRVKIGTWVAGRKGAPQGTIDWAGGLTDFSKAPFTAIYRSVKITDYTQGSAGQAYHYSDRSGTYQSIKVVPLTGSNNSEDDESSSSVTSSKPTSTTTSAAPSSTVNNATTTMVTSTTSAPVTGQSSAPSQTPASNSAAQTQFANVALMAALGYLAYLAM